MKVISYGLLIGAALLLAQTGIAVAQAINSSPTERVTVEGPYLVSRQIGMAGHFGQGTMVTISRQVSYSDVDLTTQAGYDTMRGRVEAAAADVCRELDRRYPDDASNNRACVQTSANNALRTVQDVATNLVRALRVASAR